MTVSDDKRSEGGASGQLTDRTGASSPGSAVSTVSTTGRRYLEWDYGSDLGLQSHQTQGEAAQSLSQLEKLAISNYSEYLGDGGNKSGHEEGRLHLPPSHGDQVDGIFNKFADSLMRQRQLQQQSRQSVIKTRPGPESRKHSDVVKKTTDSHSQSTRVKSPVKSSSLGSLAETGPYGGGQVSGDRCSSSVSCNSLSPAAAVLMSGPSSSSSAGTIIARPGPRQVPGLSDVIRKLSLDLLESDSDHLEPENSKSVSTVSTVDDEIPKLSSMSPPDKPKVVWEHTSNFQTFTDNQISEPKASDVYHPPHHSEPSSVPTTSDEETLERPKRCVGGSDGDTSTMESAQMEADRAKSFEYIPGETFNMQENSSSYEYLPGHLVEDNRPPTVLNNVQAPPAGPDNDQFDDVDNNLHPVSLDHLSSELRDKSKDLMAKNISQTKHFFKKLKGYIEFLSTPSLTVEDSRVKQELAERILALLSNEEARLGHGAASSGLTSRELSVRSLNFDNLEAISGSAVDKKSGETSTRQLPWPEQETQKLKKSVKSKEVSRDKSRDSDGTSMSSEMKESDNSSRMSEWKHNKTKSELEYQLKHGHLDTTEAVEIVQKLQRKRLEHMKKLKKEMKKLEKIDSLIVGAGSGRKVPDLSISSSVTSVSISLESGYSQEQEVIRATKTKTVTNTNILKVNSDRSSRIENERSKTTNVDDEKENTDNSNKIVLEHISPIVTRASPKRSSTVKSSTVRSSQNFGQVYPSDTTNTNTMTDSNVETLNSNGTFITKKSPKQRKRSPKKVRSPKKSNVPVAYYLPVDNLSPIRIGSRVLRENNGWTGADQRNILSGYMASLDTQPIARKTPVQSTSTDVSNNVSNQDSLTLQQALARRRKDFLRSCEKRIVAMKKAREARMLRTAKQEAWLEQLARQSPRSQKFAEPSFSPVPVVRVFNHREMVQATRDKYQELPEVKFAKMDARRSVRYQGHRLMSRIYSNRLQRKVVGRRQVSFTVHQLVV